MIIDPIDLEVSQLCGEYYLPPDLFHELDAEDDGRGCARGIFNALAIMGVIYLALFAGAWLIRWLQH